jgi:N-acetylneuraminic acid mutarotase
VKSKHKAWLCKLAAIACCVSAVLLTACGGSSPVASALAPTYTIGVTVSGLTTGTLVLQNNGNETLSANLNGVFSFTTGLASGLSYSVTVATQPSGYRCSVTNGTGTIGAANVTGVTVSCQLTNAWTWMSGSTTINGSPVYGTKGVADPTNVPATRLSAISWNDNAGDLWLMGGSERDSAGAPSFLNDLWKYNTSTSQWTWVSGSNTTDSIGVYGSMGTADPANVPGARAAAISWSDSAGNLWLMGGYGRDTNGVMGRMNDLWKYNKATSKWTWISGSNTFGSFGVYGVMGTADPANAPGARAAAISWSDSTGNLWLMGGYGRDSVGGLGYLNDLWKFNMATSQWTWMSGSNIVNSSGVYGTMGVADPTNLPGARAAAISWSDSTGNLWLMGGGGYDGVGVVGYLSDLWKYNTSNGQWTWVSGSSNNGNSGVYGVIGTANSVNVPGARSAAINWSDGAGNFWLMGGSGVDSVGNTGSLNDLWKYNTSNGQWTWVSGSSTNGISGVYGVMGTANSANVPGARSAAISWSDRAGNFWLMGGSGVDSVGGIGNLNDLWKYVPR